MAIRTTASEVKQIMENCTLDDPTVSAFIVAASEVVSQTLAATLIGDILLKEIEKYFTAHLIASVKQRTTSDEKLGDASVKYTGQWGKNLDSTPYGQVVKTLDTTGKMSNLGKQAASVFAIPSFPVDPSDFS
jgi:hypothetical protein